MSWDAKECTDKAVVQTNRREQDAVSKRYLATVKDYLIQEIEDAFRIIEKNVLTGNNGPIDPHSQHLGYLKGLKHAQIIIELLELNGMKRSPYDYPENTGSGGSGAV